MYPIIWFAIMMALCVVYAARADTYWGPQKRFFIDWPHATILALVVVVVGFMVAGGNPVTSKDGAGVAATSSKTTTSASPTRSSKMSWKERQAAKAKKEKEEKKAEEEEEKRQMAYEASNKMRAIVAFHAIGITLAIFASLVLWRKEIWYPYAVSMVGMIVTVSYYLWIGTDFLGNFVLVLVAVGFSLLGRVTTKRGFVVAYAILVGFDMYSIWGSDLMSLISTNYPGVFPKYLSVDTISTLSRGIGAGDVIFAAIACNHIHQHIGWRRAAFFAVTCSLGILIGILMPGQTPLLIFVAPIAIFTLLIPKGFIRID